MRTTRFPSFRALTGTLAFTLAFLLACTLASPILAQDSPYEIRLLGETAIPAAGLDPAQLEELAAQAAAAGIEVLHFLAQVYELPDEKKLGELADRGLRLGTYVSGNAFLAVMKAAELPTLAAIPEIRAIVPWTAERKQHPRLLDGDIGAWARNSDNPELVMLFVQLHADVELSRLATLAEELGATTLGPVAALNGATFWLPQDHIGRLAAYEEVMWIEEGPMPLDSNNDGIRAYTGVDSVWNDYVLDGTGTRVFVYDRGIPRTTHQTFKESWSSPSRVTSLENSSILPSHHATHVAGTIAGSGAGTTNGIGRGIAYAAKILASSYEATGNFGFWENAGDLASDFGKARDPYEADLANASLGSNIANNLAWDCAREGDYGVTSNLLDNQVYGGGFGPQEAILQVWSGGNERSGGPYGGRCGVAYATMAPPACAKNPIQVGAINSDGGSMTYSSSWGPCDDGRIKPVVTAPGCAYYQVAGNNHIYSAVNNSDTSYGVMCGTSMAAAGVSGIVSLFLQGWRDLGHGGPFDRPLPALVKALLIHTARDLGQRGPDYLFGYGSVDAKALIDTLHAGTGNLAADGPAVWGTDAVKHGQTDSWRIVVPANTETLKASLAWDDLPAPAFAGATQVNNLTLRLISPFGSVHNAYVLNPAQPHLEATTGLNSLDNQEQVVVNLPAPGEWTVQVLGAHVPTISQTYGLVFEARPRLYEPTTCTAQGFGFETGNDGFALSGAARTAAPAAGHGAYSLRFGGVAGSIHRAYRNITVPTNARRAVLSFYAYQTTTETTLPGIGSDPFTAEIQDTQGATLAVVATRSAGWKSGAWMRVFEVDLRSWAGQTVRIAFRSGNSPQYPTTYWVDGISLRTCL